MKYFNFVLGNLVGTRLPSLPKLLRRSGRYTSSGHIVGPIVDFDMRDIYLKDISLTGATVWDEPVLPNLICYTEAGKINPLLL